MKYLSAIAVITFFCISFQANAQSRSFHAQELVLDNGSNTKTSTLFYAGASAQTLDLTKISTNADTLLLGVNLDLQNNNITNGGNAFLASVTASGNINSTAGVIQTNGVTRIDNSGNGTFGTVAATGNINSSGGTLQTNGVTRIDNSGNGTFGTVAATGNINSSGGTLQTNGVTRIDNSGNGTFGGISANVTQMFAAVYSVASSDYLIVNQNFSPFPFLFMPSSFLSRGRILVVENPNTFIFPVLILPSVGDNINFTGVNSSYSLNPGNSIMLMSDGLGNWIKTN